MLTYGLGPLLGLISGPILARSLGPEGRGQFSSIMEPLTLAGALASVGIPSAVTFFITRGQDPTKILRRALLFALPTTALSFAVLCFYGHIVSSKQGIPMWVLVSLWSTVVASAGIQILRGYWQGLARWKRLDIERFSFATIRFLAIVLIAALGFSNAGVFAAGALVAFMMTGLLLVPSKKIPSGSQNAVGSHQQFINYSLVTALGTIAVVSNNRLDQVLLPTVATSAEIGFYAVAVTVAEVPVIFATLAARNAFTLSGNGCSLGQTLRDIKLFLAFGFATAVILCLFAPYYTTLLFGDLFARSILSVQILSLGTILSIFTFVGIAILSGKGRIWQSSAVPAIGLLTTCAGFVLFGQQMDSTMASLISASSQLTAAITAIILVIRSRNFANHLSRSTESRVADGH